MSGVGSSNPVGQCDVLQNAMANASDTLVKERGSVTLCFSNGTLYSGYQILNEVGCGGFCV